MNHRGVFALALVMCAACAQSEDGALGQAGLSAACSDEDAGCLDLGLAAPLAVGASLAVDLTSLSAGQSLPPVRLESAIPETLSVEGGTLVSLAPGVTALLVTAEDGTVIDFFHVTTEAPDAVVIATGDDARPPEEAVQLLVGDELDLSAAPVRAGQRLAGALAPAWSSTDESVVSLLGTGHPGERRLVAREPGAVTVQVDALGLSGTLAVEVLP